jgi:hypothetical protein
MKLLRDKLECSAAYAPVNSVPRLVMGMWLAHAKLSKAERAYLAGDLYTGAARLVEPTMLQAAMLARVNVTYAHWAIKRPNDRLLVESGAVPLVPPAGPKALPKPVSPLDRLADVVAELGMNGTLNALTMIEGATVAAE